MFPVMASEPKMDMSNVQSCSHEKELFVLLLQTQEEKMGCSFHVLDCICKPCEVKNKKHSSPGIEPGFQLWPSNTKPEQRQRPESACTCSLCVCSVFLPLCVIRRLWLSAMEPLWDVGPCSLKGWTMPVLLWAFLCNKITQKRHFQEVQRQIKTLFCFYAPCVFSSGLCFFFFCNISGIGVPAPINRNLVCFQLCVNSLGKTLSCSNMTVPLCTKSGP